MKTRWIVSLKLLTFHFIQFYDYFILFVFLIKNVLEIYTDTKGTKFVTISAMIVETHRAISFRFKQDIAVPSLYDMINPGGFEGIYFLETTLSPTFIGKVLYSGRFVVEENPVMTIDARLGYRDKSDPISNWTEIARSSEERLLKCKIQKVRE